MVTWSSRNIGFRNIVVGAVIVVTGFGCGGGSSAPAPTPPPPSAPAPLTPVISAPTAAYKGQSYQASTPAQPSCTFSWGITGGRILSGQASNTITFIADSLGTLELTCLARNGANVSSATAKIALTVTDIPTTTDTSLVPSGTWPWVAEPGATVRFMGTHLSALTGLKVGGIETPFSILNDGYMTATIPMGLTNGFPSVELQVGAARRTESYAVCLRGGQTASSEGRDWYLPMQFSWMSVIGGSSNDYPKVISLPSGRALAIWSSYSLAAVGSPWDGRGLWASFFDPTTGWSQQEPLGRRDQPFLEPDFSIVSDQTGRAWVLGLGKRYDQVQGSMSSGIYSVPFVPGDGWQAPELLAPVPANQSFSRVQGVALDQGTLFLAWQHDGNAGDPNLIRCMTYSTAGGWVGIDSANVPDSASNVSLSSVTSSPDGKVLFSWIDHPVPGSGYLSTGTVSTREWDPVSGWSSVQRHPGAPWVQDASPQLAGNAQGGRLLAWVAGADPNQCYAQSAEYLPGTGWQSKGNPLPGIRYSNYGMTQSDIRIFKLVQVGLSATGDGVFVTCVQPETGANYNLFQIFSVTCSAGNNWESPVEMGGATAYSKFRPILASNALGDVAVTWSDWGARPDGLTAMVQTRPHGKAWLAPVRVDRVTDPYSDANLPMISLAFDGRLTTAWRSDFDMGPDGSIFSGVMANVGTVDAPYGNLGRLSSKSYGEAKHPALDVRADGTFMLAWDQSAGPLHNILGGFMQPPFGDFTLNPGSAPTLELPYGFLNYPFGCSSFGAFTYKPQVSLSRAYQLPQMPNPSGSVSWIREPLSAGSSPWQSGAEDVTLSILSGLHPPGTIVGGDLPGSALKQFLVNIPVNGNTMDIRQSYTLTTTGDVGDPPFNLNTAPALDLDVASDEATRLLLLWQQGSGSASEAWLALQDWQQDANSIPASRMALVPLGSCSLRAGISANGARIITWTNMAATEIWALLYTSGMGWGSPFPVTQPQLPVSNTQISANATGEFALTWLQTNGASTEIWGRVYHPASGWTPSQRVSPQGGQASGPCVSISNQGNAIYGYLLTKFGHSDVWTAHWNRTFGLYPSRLVSDGQSDCSELRLKIAPAGHGLAAWTQTTAGKSQVFFNYYY